jgi:hypothetical protein
LVPNIASADCNRVGPAAVGATCASPPPSSSGSTAGSNPSPDGAAGKFLALINKERAARGLGGLGRNTQLEGIALRHAHNMANAGRIYHNSSLFTQATIDSLGSPDEVGENVGRGTDVQTLHDTFMDSPSHKANILGGSYTTSGIAVISQSGELWVVQTFMSPPHRWTGGSFVNNRARPAFQDVPPAVASRIDIGVGARWQNPRGSAPAIVGGVARETEVLGLRKTFGSSGSRSAKAVIFVLAFSVVAGAALPRKREAAEYV